MPSTPPPTPLGRAFGAAVRARRTATGTTLEAFADLAGMNVTYLSDIERGVQNPSLRKMEDLAIALGLPLSALVAEAEELTDQ